MAIDINPIILTEQILNARINISGCDSGGNVFDVDGVTQIQTRPDVAAIIAAYDPNYKTQAQIDQTAAVTNYKTMPAWAATMNMTDAAAYINNQIWGGVTIAQANSYIDTTVIDLPTARTALKQIAAAIIDMRSLFILTSQLLICIRDLVIRYR